MSRFYQNVPVEGATYEDEKRKDSKFWNEGKWNNFVKPSLPEGRTFIDIGCNAGLFCKLAVDAGFKDVIGIEGHSKRMAQATAYKVVNKYPYRLVQQTVGVDFNLEELPLADVVLFSNVHYYIPVNDFSKLVDQLYNRSVYCIVVSAKVKRFSGNALYDINSLRGYFRNWAEIRVIEGVEEEDDPAPRPRMYSVLFKGNLHSYNVEAIYGSWKKGCLRANKHKYSALPEALEGFFAKIFNKEGVDFKKTKLFDYWRIREPNHSEEWIVKKLERKKTLAESVRVNGLREPIYYDHRGNFIDGLHRLAIARELGYETILARRL